MIFKLISILFVLSIESLAIADDYSLWEVDKLSFEHKWIDQYHDPYIPNDTMLYKDDLYWDVKLFNRIFWDNNVEMYSNQAKVVSVGWQFYLGIKVTDWLDIVRDHHSRHVLEEYRAPSTYPLDDSYGFRVNFIKK